MRLTEAYAARSVRFLETWEQRGWRMKVYGLAYRSDEPAAELVAAAKRAAERCLPDPAIDDASRRRGAAGRRLQKVNVQVLDAGGQPADEASITVDGGMPQHGHGLPTRPRMTSRLGGGIYEIDGVRFNMGGWWQLQLTIRAAQGTDTVTFNLDL